MAFARGTAFGGVRSAAVGPAFGAKAAPAPLTPKDLECPLPPDTDSVQTLAWAPTTHHLAAGSWDGKVRVWEIARAADGTPTGSTGVSEMGFEAPLLDLAWKEDGAHIFGATAGNLVKMWSIQGNTVSDIAKHDAPIQNLFWLADKSCLVTGSWDKTLKYWDPRAGATPSFNLPLPDKVVSMDIKGRLMLLALADRSVHILDVENPSAPIRSLDVAATRIKNQIRCVRAFHDQATFAIGGVEGRVAVHLVDEAMDKQTDPVDNKYVHSFTFKCHRQEPQVYPVNFIDTHPATGYQTIFGTVGGDGVYAFWDKGRRGRNNEYGPCLKKQTITSGLWNPVGDLFAYSMSYDWHMGSEGVSKFPGHQLCVHYMSADDMKLTDK